MQSLSQHPALDIEKIRADFPILAEYVNGQPVCYLDNAASAQKPKPVIDAVRWCYEQCYANVHRGTYDFSARTTKAYEQARETVQGFLNANSAREIIFTANATTAINLVAHSYGRGLLQAGDRVLISAMEHHSNIVPWQLLCAEKDLILEVIPVADDGTLDLSAFDRLIAHKVKLVAITHISNVLGTLNPLDYLIKRAHEHGAKLLVDGSQAVMHTPVDVQSLDCDFYVFTGHKIYGPSGIGVLYGKEDILKAMPPFLGGGEMIKSVSFEKSTWADLPAKFEAGTPPIIQAIGLGAAIEYVENIGYDMIQAHEMSLLDKALHGLGAMAGIRIIGTAQSRGPVISFTMESGHHHDVSSLLDQDGIAVRAGHHCAEPLMQRYGISGTTRVSFGLYNSLDEIDKFLHSLTKVQKLLRLG